MLKADNGATMETDLEETPAGWVARYLIVSKDLGQLKPQRRLFSSKADAVTWPHCGGDSSRLRFRTADLDRGRAPQG
jgi:hypothetical protein